MAAPPAQQDGTTASTTTATSSSLGASNGNNATTTILRVKRRRTDAPHGLPGTLLLSTTSDYCSGRSGHEGGSRAKKRSRRPADDEVNVKLAELMHQSTYIGKRNDEARIAKVAASSSGERTAERGKKQRGAGAGAPGAALFRRVVDTKADLAVAAAAAAAVASAAGGGRSKRVRVVDAHLLLRETSSGSSSPSSDGKDGVSGGGRSSGGVSGEIGGRKAKRPRLALRVVGSRDIESGAGSVNGGSITNGCSSNGGGKGAGLLGGVDFWREALASKPKPPRAASAAAAAAAASPGSLWQDPSAARLSIIKGGGNMNGLNFPRSASPTDAAPKNGTRTTVVAANAAIATNMGNDATKKSNATASSVGTKPSSTNSALHEAKSIVSRSLLSLFHHHNHDETNAASAVTAHLNLLTTDPTIRSAAIPGGDVWRETFLDLVAREEPQEKDGFNSTLNGFHGADNNGVNGSRDGGTARIGIQNGRSAAKDGGGGGGGGGGGSTKILGTVLHAAALRDDVVGAQLALQKGCDATSRDGDGRTAWEVATLAGSMGVARVIESYGGGGDAAVTEAGGGDDAMMGDDSAVDWRGAGECAADDETDASSSGGRGGKEGEGGIGGESERDRGDDGANDGRDGGGDDDDDDDEYVYDVYCLAAAQDEAREVDDWDGWEERRRSAAGGGGDGGDAAAGPDRPRAASSASSSYPSGASDRFEAEFRAAAATAMAEDVEADDYKDEDEDGHCRVDITGGIGYWTERGELVLEPTPASRSIRGIHGDHHGGDDVSFVDGDDDCDSNDEAYAGNDYPEDEDGDGGGNGDDDDYDYGEDGYDPTSSYARYVHASAVGSRAVQSFDSSDDEDLAGYYNSHNGNGNGGAYDGTYRSYPVPASAFQRSGFSGGFGSANAVGGGGGIASYGDNGPCDGFGGVSGAWGGGGDDDEVWDTGGGSEYGGPMVGAMTPRTGFGMGGSGGGEAFAYDPELDHDD